MTKRLDRGNSCGLIIVYESKSCTKINSFIAQKGNKKNKQTTLPLLVIRIIKCLETRFLQIEMGKICTCLIITIIVANDSMLFKQRHFCLISNCFKVCLFKIDFAKSRLIHFFFQNKWNKLACCLNEKLNFQCTKVICTLRSAVDDLRWALYILQKWRINEIPKVPRNERQNYEHHSNNLQYHIY